MIHRQSLLSRVPVRDLTAWLQRNASVAAKLEGRFDDRIRLRKRLVHFAYVQTPGKAEVVAKFGMNQRRRFIERGLDVDHRQQALKVDVKVLQRVLGLLPGLGHDGHDRFTLPTCTIDRERILRRRLHPGKVRQSRHPRFTDPRQVVPVGDHNHPRHCPCGVRMDRENPAVRDLTAPEHHMRHARQFNIVGIGPLTLDKPSDAWTIRIRADVTRVLGEGMQGLITLIDPSRALLGGLMCVHWPASFTADPSDPVAPANPVRAARCARVSQMASTMA